MALVPPKRIIELGSKIVLNEKEAKELKSLCNSYNKQNSYYSYNDMASYSIGSLIGYIAGTM